MKYFMSFKMGTLKFIDSFQFMGSSLEKLVENLYDKDDTYKNFNSMKNILINISLSYVKKVNILMSGWTMLKN